MKKICFILLIVSSLCVSNLLAQRSTFRVACYNVENLFDVRDDSLTNDSEYLPGGMRGWNYTRYKKKLSNISKVLTAVGGWESLALVGLCEIENRHVLDELTKFSPLKAFGYQIVQYESPDARGVDVALLYSKDKFRVLHSQPIAIRFPNDPKKRTRDILHVCGIADETDTLHVFVNHFPSRLGGELASEPNRMLVATVMRQKVDSIFAKNAAANILIMGDFNDYPPNRSLSETLDAQPFNENIRPEHSQLYNLFYQIHTEGKIGSYKHAGEWGMLDQMIVSGALLQADNRLSVAPNSAKIFDAEWLLEEDKKNLGKQPKRTYIGMKFNDGFSDHLPIFVDFVIKKITF